MNLRHGLARPAMFTGSAKIEGKTRLVSLPDLSAPVISLSSVRSPHGRANRASLRERQALSESHL